MPEEIGTIMSAEEADENYGSVISSVQISSSLLSSLSEQTNNLMMFKIIQNKLYILGDSRAVLYPQGESVNSEEVFAVYSKSMVIELIETGGGNNTIVEKRTDVFSLKNEGHVLEVAQWCPPFCGPN
jgi:hypothetical protein